jgi:putative transposase
MRTAGIVGASRRRWTRTTWRDREARPAPDLVQREFEASGQDRLWVADIIYIPTWAGFLYLAVVLASDGRGRASPGSGHLRARPSQALIPEDGEEGGMSQKLVI